MRKGIGGGHGRCCCRLGQRHTAVTLTRSVLLHDRGAQVGLLDRVDAQLCEGTTTYTAGQWARVDHQRSEYIFGEGVQAGRENQYVGMGLELPVLRVAQIILYYKIKQSKADRNIK